MGETGRITGGIVGGIVGLIIGMLTLFHGNHIVWTIIACVLTVPTGIILGRWYDFRP